MRNVGFGQVLVLLLLCVFLFGDLIHFKNKLRVFGGKVRRLFSENIRKKGSWTLDLWFWKPLFYLWTIFLIYSNFPYSFDFMFYKYYFELKHRFLFLLLCWVYAILVSYIFKEVLLHFITKNSLESNVTAYFIFTDVVEVFSVYLILIFFFGHQMAILNFFYHFLVFVLSSLTKLESQVLVRAFFICNALSVTAFVVYHKFIFVASWKFFFNLKNFTTVQSLILHFEARLLEFSTLYIKLYKICFLYFQFFLVPILLFTTVRLELRIYSSFRKLLYYFCVFFSTVVTPPDVFSQVFLSCSTIICCEILIYLLMFKTILISSDKLH